MENWKDIEGYEGRFQVSDAGRVRNKTGVIIGQETTQRGYLRVTFTENKTRKRFRVHRLVASAFIPNPDNLPQIDHINGDKTDNRVENLRWVTNRENCNYANKREPRKGMVVAFDKDGNETAYPSMSAAAREMGVSRYGVMAAIGGEQKTTADGIRLMWWEREKLLTTKDKQAIQKAIQTYYADIDENWAETELGREELRKIERRKYRDEEWLAGMG